MNELDNLRAGEADGDAVWNSTTSSFFSPLKWEFIAVENILATRANRGRYLLDKSRGRDKRVRTYLCGRYTHALVKSVCHFTKFFGTN